MRSICIFVILYALSCTNGKTVRRYKFGIDCSVSLEYVDEAVVVYAEYDGTGRIDNIWCNKMSNGYLNEYKICLKPDRYEDPNCAIEMSYNYDGYAVKSFTCSDKPTEMYCGRQNKNFYITLKTLKDDNDIRQARMVLKIEAVVPYDHGQMVGIIIGSIIGGIVLIGVVVGVIFFACRRKRSPGQVMTPAPTTSVPMQQTNETMPFVPTDGYKQSPQQPTGFTSSDQPPPYADA